MSTKIDKSFFINPVDENEIIKVINSFKEGKSVGDDDIPIKLFKHCKYVLSKPISILVNLSFKTGTFPNKL